MVLRIPRQRGGELTLRWRRMLGRAGVAIAGVLGVAAVGYTVFSYFTVGPSVRDVSPRGNARRERAARGPVKTAVKVLTLNLAHGRGTGPHQIVRSAHAIRANLDTVAAVIRAHAPDIVALQEADAPSFWSGAFDHVRYLADKTGLPYVFHGKHVQGPMIAYGTALLSKLELYDRASTTFEPFPPSYAKGFIVATVHWPGLPQIEIDIVSVHAGFFTRSNHKRQLDSMARQLE